MPKNVNVLILRTAGTNCDAETAFAFKSFGARVDLVHVKKLVSGGVSLDDYHILAVPGGFSYGDDIESGRILANELRLKLGPQITEFLAKKKLIIGICNGFQILVKAGILPGPLNGNDDKIFSQTTTLVNNDSGKFEDRWVKLKVNNKSVWTQGMPDVVTFPVAHGEGKFIAKDQEVLRKIVQNHQVAFTYASSNGRAPAYPENPNGSLENIAGITDKTGRILGLMPHPERHFLFIQNPRWMRTAAKKKFGDGAKIFENGINYVKDNL